MLLIIHNVRSVYNVASMYRTADGAGVSEILLSGYTPGPLDRFGLPRKDFAKVALGAEKVVRWRTVDNLQQELLSLRKEAYHLIALEQDERALNLLTFTPPTKSALVLVVGNEVGGIEKELLDLVDTILEIPMHGTKESLNVSVATGVALYTLTQ